MRTVSATVGTFGNLEGENGSMFVSGFSVHIVGDPKPTLVRYWSNDEGKLFVEIYEHEQQVWKPYLPNFDAQALRAQFGDTVLEGALKQDVLFWLELSNEDAIAEGQDLISHSHWTSAEADAGRFWTYHSISIAGRNAPITFRHTTTGDEITPLVQVHDYRTGRWEPFEIIRQYYDFESFRSTAAATGYLSELIPHLNTLTSDLPASDLRKAGGGIATQKQTQPAGKPHGLPAAPPENPLYRRCVRVLSMVHELHKAGYQRIRILPMLSPSGCYWRGVITFADNVAQDGYRILREEEEMVARYTSGQDNEYFGWKDASNASARDMARLFLERFPDICRKGEGLDWAYAGWLTDVLGHAELGEDKGGLIHLIQDWENEPEYMARWTPPPPTR